MTFTRFLNMIFSRAQYSAECNIIAWTFVTRLTADKTLSLTMQNWRGVWVAAINVAQKVSCSGRIFKERDVYLF